MTDKRFKDDVVFSFLSAAVASPLITYLILSGIDGNNDAALKYIGCYTLNQVVFNFIFNMKSYKLWFRN
ncbi:MAG: hypothetical protein RR346_07005 [Bacteroidales bacterium]